MVSVALGDESLEVGPEDVTIERLVKIDWLVQSSGAYVAAIDPVLTDDLRSDGLAREIVSRVQRLRKDAGYDYSARIVLAVAGPPEVLGAVRRHQAMIEHETLAKEVVVGTLNGRADAADTVELDGHTVTIAVTRWKAE